MVLACKSFETIAPTIDVDHNEQRTKGAPGHRRRRELIRWRTWCIVRGHCAQSHQIVHCVCFTLHILDAQASSAIIPEQISAQVIENQNLSD